MKNNFLSIVVPVYNEQNSVRSTLESIKAVMKKTGMAHEIIAVDDCSKDSSGKVLKSISGVKVLHHMVNRGYSSSLKTGIRAAEGNLILIIDADGTYPVEDIPRLLEHVDKFDMIIGARVGKNVHIPLMRRPAKWFLGQLANYIAGVRIPDINSGLRVFKKDVALDFWELLPQRFSFTITTTMASITRGYNVKFIPIDYHKRAGKSSIHPIKDFLGFNKILLRMSLFFKPMKIFVPLSVLVFLAGFGILIIGVTFLNRFYDITFVLTTLSSIQIFMLGLIAELIIRTKRSR
jgi:polyisoprenyl-phosphate glycosyltransferase